MSGTGILGGTFNPVHIGHIRHAVEVREALGLDNVLLSPSAVPPHKEGRGILPFDLRLDMVRAATDEVACLDTTGLEGEIDGPSYSYVVLREWGRLHPEAGLPYFMMGVEDFAQLGGWYRGRELINVARLVVVPRAGSDRELFLNTVNSLWPDAPDAVPEGEACGADGRCRVLAPGGGQCLFLPVPRLDISSSFIRERWLAGRDVSGLLPCRVISILEASRSEARAAWVPAEEVRIPRPF